MVGDVIVRLLPSTAERETVDAEGELPTEKQQTPAQVTQSLDEGSKVLSLSTAYTRGDEECVPDVSDEKLGELMQEEQSTMAYDFARIQNDPRFRRLVEKYDPSVRASVDVYRDMLSSRDVAPLPRPV